MIAGLIAGIIIGCSALAASVMFKEEGKIAWTRAGTLFALAAIITTVASKVPAWIAMLLLLVVLAMMGYLVLWWMENGSIKRELVAFAIMMLVLWQIAMANAVRIIGITSIGWLIGSIRSIPTIVFFMSIGYMIADMIWFRGKMKKKGGKENEA